jgi:hypothetical protein
MGAPRQSAAGHDLRAGSATSGTNGGNLGVGGGGGTAIEEGIASGYGRQASISASAVQASQEDSDTQGLSSDGEATGEGVAAAPAVVGSPGQLQGTTATVTLGGQEGSQQQGAVKRPGKKARIKAQDQQAVLPAQAPVPAKV